LASYTPVLPRFSLHAPLFGCSFLSCLFLLLFPQSISFYTLQPFGLPLASPFFYELFLYFLRFVRTPSSIGPVCGRSRFSLPKGLLSSGALVDRLRPLSSIFRLCSIKTLWSRNEWAVGGLAMLLRSPLLCLALYRGIFLTFPPKNILDRDFFAFCRGAFTAP